VCRSLIIGALDLLHLLENTFDRKHISAKPGLNPKPNSNPNPKAQ